MITANASQRECQKHWNKLHFRVLERNNNKFIWSKLFLVSVFLHVLTWIPTCSELRNLSFFLELGEPCYISLWWCTQSFDKLTLGGAPLHSIRESSWRRIDWKLWSWANPATSVSDDATVLWQINPWWSPLASHSGILWRRDLIENEEFEIDVIEDAIEGEHSYKCDEEFRTGWNSS